MKILVAGGTGTICSLLVAQLVACGAESQPSPDRAGVPTQIDG